MLRGIMQGLLESRNLEVRGLEEAMESQAVDRSQQGAASAARQQDLVRGQADARKALICLKEELAAAQAAPPRGALSVPTAPIQSSSSTAGAPVLLCFFIYHMPCYSSPHK